MYVLEFNAITFLNSEDHVLKLLDLHHQWCVSVSITLSSERGCWFKVQVC